jgi:hypothetical protein
MSRDEYLIEIEKILSEENFVKNNDEYVRTDSFQQPGQIMIINGQSFQQPGALIKVEFIIKDLGETWIEDYNGKVYVEQFKFMIKQDDEISFELDELMYFEKPELILQYFKK